MKRLQAKYKNDRQKLNEEMMKFYKEHNVNPLAGCLPLVLQMPLFIVLYRLIHDLTKVVIVGAIVVGGVPSTDALAGAQITHVQFHGAGRSAAKIVDGKLTNATVSADVEVSGRVVGKLSGAKVDDGVVHGPKKTDPVTVVDASSKRIGTIQGLMVEGGRLVAQPKHIPKGSKLKAALQKHPGHMESWGIDLAKRPGDAGKAGLGGAWPYYLLVLAVVGSGYYQQRQMTARTPASAQNQQAQMMGRIFPAFFGLISLSIPAGVVVYFIASNLWQIGQQAWIFREQDAAKAKGSSPTSGRGAPPRDADSREVDPNAAPKPQARSSQRSGNRRRKRKR
jgi:YidC/Oxa1 family membrane protein insertase